MLMSDWTIITQRIGGWRCTARVLVERKWRWWWFWWRGGSALIDYFSLIHDDGRKIFEDFSNETAAVFPGASYGHLDSGVPLLCFDGKQFRFVIRADPCSDVRS